jgi:hypothetical protein
VAVPFIILLLGILPLGIYFMTPSALDSGVRPAQETPPREPGAFHKPFPDPAGSESDVPTAPQTPHHWKLPIHSYGNSADLRDSSL